MSTRISIILFLTLLFACDSDVKTTESSPTADSKSLFVAVNEDVSGVFFRNNVKESPSLNHLKYIFFYNGGGVAAGDVNNDGLCDLYFTSNQESNKLYINQGDFKFEDITETAGVQDDTGWTTGVTMVDINDDGLLDFYVCKAGSVSDSDAEETNSLLIRVTTHS